ncbi:hypothetical protein HispidOSU_004271, partial [Sigmodon hispidus]
NNLLKAQSPIRSVWLIGRLQAYTLFCLPKQESKHLLMSSCTVHKTGALPLTKDETASTRQ